MKRTIDIDLAEVERLAGIGMSDTEICSCLNVSRSTFFRRKKVSRDLQESLFRGRARAKANVAGALYKKAMEGSLQAQIFYLKMRGGWDNNQSQAEDDGHDEESREALVSRICKLFTRNAEAKDIKWPYDERGL